MLLRSPPHVVAGPGSNAALLVLWWPLLLMHVVGPLVDKLLLGEQPLLTQDAASPASQQAVVACSWVPVAFAALHVTAWVAACSTAGALGSRGALSAQLLCSLVAGLGASMTLSMSVSHELIHRREAWQRAVGLMQLALTQLSCYARAHMHHHLHVGLPSDHSTARLGEPFWHFLARYWQGTHAVAWHEVVEARRRKCSLWGLSNSTLVGLLMQAGAMFLSWCLGGMPAVAVHLGAAALGIINLAALDYLFHYGLVRQRRADGTYAPATTSSAFNSAFPVENALLLRVLMHSSHHHAASKPYRLLGFTQSDVASSAQPHHKGVEQHQQQEEQQLDAAAPRFAHGWPMLLVGLTVFVPPVFLPLAEPLAHRANQAHRREVAQSGLL